MVDFYPNDFANQLKAVVGPGDSMIASWVVTVQPGMCVAVLPETALASLDAKKLHRLPIPDKFTLCLAWTPRNVDTRPALAELIATLRVNMVL